RQFAQPRFILNQENRFVAADCTADVAAGLGRERGRESRWEKNLEGRSHHELADDLDPALVLLDDAIDGRQTETGAFANALGGEERLENVGERVRIHAATGIADLQADESAGTRLRLATHMKSIHLQELGA